MLHYHGTPLTPRAELMKLAGKNFCVPFSDPRDADWCQAHAQAIMFDNGAFTAHTKKKQVEWKRYYEWLEPRLGHPHWAVIPDVIDGTVDEQRTLIAEWPFQPWHSAPVWHMALPISYLLDLTARFPRVCFGSSRQYWRVGSDIWCRRADEAFNALARNGPLPWIHMLRGMALAGDQWPFASVDSINVARNFKDRSVCPERMARRIDAIQCPVRWELRPEQKGMFDGVA